MSSNTGDNNGRDQLCGDGGGGSNSEEITSNKDECTSCEQNNNVDNITEVFNSAAVRDDKSTCANCGKVGNSDDMNTCNKSKMVKYCNAACKKKHRSKHKKACERRVAELYDEKLFADHPPREECPICFLPLPIQANHLTFQSCCGKVICCGCIYAMDMSEGGADLCPFCRTPDAISNEEHIKRLKKLMDKGIGAAYDILGGCYADGVLNLARDRRKANELYLKGGELGSADGYYNLGVNYERGMGVERDIKKAEHYYELAAVKG